jgi:hypothetical protein
MGKTVLIDDVRVFRDGRDCVLATSVAEGVAVLRDLQHERIDELWLDHDLGGDETIWPVVRVLEQFALKGTGWDIGVVKIHAQRSGPAYEIGVSLRRVGYRTERVSDLSVFRVSREPVPQVVRERPRRRPGAVPAIHRIACTSYRAGHHVHWIQALHTANKPEVSARSWRGRILSIEGELITVERHGGKVVRLRNHDPARLTAVIGDGSRAVLVNDQYAILRVDSYCFSVRRDEGVPLERCPADPTPAVATPEAIFARLESHGGFTAQVDSPGNVSGTRENGGLGGSQ